MKQVSEEVRTLSIKSLESTLHKLSNAYRTMNEKGSNTTLVKKRLDAVEIGLASIKATWYGMNFCYDKKTIRKTVEILRSLIPPINNQIAKAKEGSPQKTLNERRLIALKLAIETLENRDK